MEYRLTIVLLLQPPVKEMVCKLSKISHTCFNVCVLTITWHSTHAHTISKCQKGQSRYAGREVEFVGEQLEHRNKEIVHLNFNFIPARSYWIRYRKHLQ